MFRNSRKRSIHQSASSGGNKGRKPILLVAESSSSDDEGQVRSTVIRTEENDDNNANELFSKQDENIGKKNITSTTKGSYNKGTIRSRKDDTVRNNSKLSFAAAGSHRANKLLSFNENDDDASDRSRDDGANDSGSILTSSRNGHSQQQKERKRKGGELGFGGYGQSSITDDYDYDYDVYAETTQSSSLGYDIDSMKRLVSEQQHRPQTLSMDADTETSNSNASVAFRSTRTSVRKDDTDTRTDQNLTNATNLPDFIPLRDKERRTATNYQTTLMDEDESSVNQVEMTILTGDDAISFHNKNGQSDGGTDNLEVSFDEVFDGIRNGPHVPDDDFPNTVDDEFGENDDNNSWEAAVARRAGVQVPLKTNPSLVDDNDNSHRRYNRNRSSFASLVEFRSAIAKSVDALESERKDLASAEIRRKYEVEQARIELERQQSELKQNGCALDFYQHWREKMIGWIGAIREIHTKVDMILSSLHTLEADRIALDRWQDWENDTIAVLYQHKLLQRVIGRQPPDIIYHDVITTVDEFGRDVKSQHVLQREQRRRKQQKILRNRTRKEYVTTTVSSLEARLTMTNNNNFGTQSDGFVSDDEEETFRTRHDALMKALAVAVEDVDEEYTSLHNLFALFEEWYKEYPDEYNQSFANLSLADLASVLIQLELCSMNDPWDESGGYNEGRWMTIVRAAYDKGVLDDGSVERIFDKVVVPSILDIFDKRGFNIASRKQMKSFHNFIHRIEKVFPSKATQMLLKVRTRMVMYVHEQLDTIAVPLIIDAASSKSVENASSSSDTSAIDVFWKQNDTESDEIQDAIIGSTDVQFRRMNKVLLNLLRYWAPLLQQHDEQRQNDGVFQKTGSSFVECVVRFITDKYLLLLSSIRAIQRDRQELAQQRITVSSGGGTMTDVLTSSSSSALLESCGSPETSFRELMDALDNTGWLHHSQHSDLVAPVRAAAAILDSSSPIPTHG